ncbi:polysaccharide biosynthesis C-terminal domain-containing protein [Halorussus caseinilyticus]|uniref:Polysaccharide biosynthesis C-terminal domain-containing protein n=1 Tax=Halorussus caseinilyticus TaxID=3034025 RepID=A0ABD5WI88_9EURY
MRSVVTLVFQLALLLVGMEAFGILLGLALRVSSPRASSPSSAASGPRFLARDVRLHREVRPVEHPHFGHQRPLQARRPHPHLAVRRHRRGRVLRDGAPTRASGLPTDRQHLQPLQVKVSGASSLGEDVREDVSNAMTYAGLLGIPMFFGALALPDVLMRTFFGAGFGEGGVALVGIALFYVFYIYQIPLESAISGTDRPELTFRVNAAGLLVHIPLAIVLAREYGLLGVIGATLFAEVMMFFGFQLLCRKLFGGAIFPAPIAAQTVSALAMFGVITEARDAMALNYWLPVVALVAFGAAVYFAVLAVTSSHFRLTLANVLGPVYQQVLGRGQQSDG